MGSLKDFITLKTTKEFNYIYKNGRSWHTPFFVIFFKPSDEKRVGFVASKKIGNAVKRNRAKRVLKALFIKYADRLKSGNYIFVAKKDILDADFKTLEKSFEKVLKKIKVIK